MLKNDKVNLVLALLLAIGLWVYVIGVDNPTTDITRKNIPISIENEDLLREEGLVLLSVSDETISVKFSGAYSEATKVKKEDIRVVLDVEGLKAGEHTVALQISVPDKVTFKDASKRKVTVVIDELVTEEKDIVPVLSGEMDNEKEPYIVQTDKETVKITGAKTLVDSVKYISAPLDVSLVDDELRAINVDLIPVDQDGNRVENVTLSEDTVSVTAVMLNKKTVPLHVTVTGADLEDAERTVTVPKTITIKGYAAALRSISSITAESIDVGDIYEDTTLEVVPILPEGIEVAANSQNLTVKVVVKGMESCQFTYGKEAIIVEGITEDMIASLEDVQIKLTAVGKEADISSLTEKDFYFVADVSDMGPGEHQVALQCQYDKHLSELNFTPAEVTVTILEVEGKEPSDESEEE